ncbi:hypothetical protein ASB1_01280 [Helicobacter heilmannii]|nr:hypothetical protein ASB1_01280 [Helicobacter heilmannii]
MHKLKREQKKRNIRRPKIDSIAKAMLVTQMYAAHTLKATLKPPFSLSTNPSKGRLKRTKETTL